MKKMMIATLAAASVLLAVANQAHAGATLDAVQKKGFVQCGISDGLPGFSYADADGKFSGIDVDVCRGVAAAVFPQRIFEKRPYAPGEHGRTRRRTESDYAVRLREKQRLRAQYHL